MMKKKSLLTLLAALLCVANMWASVNADDYKLPGAFSVSSTKVVYFSQGNLQYTKSTGKWKIMDHQYDMVETLSQNVGTNYASQEVVTLFGWGTSGWESDTRTADFPYYTNNNNADYGVLATKSSTETLTDATTNGEKGDWGVFNSGDLGAGWRTLTNDEWGYLFNTRTPGNSVNGVSNARYTEATINTDGTAVNGIILFPDDADMTSVSGVTWGSINSSSSWGTQCTSAGWTALETAGCVFLPAAGRRNGTSVGNVGSGGFYWSSSANSATSAYFLYFYSGGVNPQSNCNRYRGCSVRLVTETAPAPSMTETPLTFEAVEAGAVVTYTMNSIKPVQYSLNGGAWTNYSSAITLSNVGDKVSFRGNNTNYNNSDPKFQCSADCYIYGNIMSLVNATNFATATTLTANKTFFMMFLNNTQIKNHPSKDLILPATTLSENCYSFMFDGCTGLTSAPALPATTLTKNCYYCMFRGCTGLTGAPALPATTLADYCYYYMFRDCTGLISAPELPVTTLANFCYAYMFKGCTGLTSAPALPATTLANFCYASMFEDCTGLTSAPALPATTLANNCYYCMFEDCTGLTSAPALPATTLATACYESMFYGCTGLTSAPELPATTLVTNCYLQMFYGCTNLSSVTCYATSGSTNYATTGWLGNVAASGTFYAPKNSVFASEARGTGSIPEGWTFSPFQASLATAPTAVSGLEYTGSAQALINNDGVAVGGTLNYSLDNTNWSEDIPTGTNAGDYTVYYMVVGDDSHADYTPSPNTVAATIAKAPLTITADEKWIDYGDELMYMVATYTGFVNGEDAAVVSPAVHFSSDYTLGDNAGTYTITPYGAGAANYEISYQTGVLHVNKVASTITTTPTAIDGLVANGSAQTLINAGEAIGGEMQYSLNNLSWSTELPTGTDANTYTVYYKVVGDINHTHISAASFEVTIAAPAPAPEFVVIFPNEDPQNQGIYYATFFDGSVKYQLPNDGTEAYAAEVSGDAMYLHKIAEGDDVLPAGTAVIFKTSSDAITLTPSDEAPVAITVTNHLHGVDAETEISAVVTGTCYVLSGGSNGVGFYLYQAPNKLHAHKAYIDLNTTSGAAQAPRRLRFVFDAATDIENVQGDKVQSTKVIENGVLYIIKNGVKYNAQGQIVK